MSYEPSALSPERRDEIAAAIPILIEELRKHRKKHKELVSKRTIDLREPAWVRVSPGPPLEGDASSYRLCIGFQNVGCKFREEDRLGLGCLNCGYYARTAFQDVGSGTIVEQFKVGLMRGSEETRGFKYNSVEFLNDGSFLNPAEFNKETQSSLFRLVSQMPHVKRVLVESRPQYVRAEAVQLLLSSLRTDQALEIGVGLESVDEFVRDVCVNKGFTRRDFEDAIDVVSSLAALYGGRLSLVVYLIVKPAFLVHSECIRDIVASLRYLYAANKAYGCRVVPKLEPAAIADGTMLSMLHEMRDTTSWYEPLNYWAVLEILATVACEMSDGDFEVRVGAREDMDDVVKAPAVYERDGETFHPFDFVIYESIQKFNQHQNYYRLFAVVEEVHRSSLGIGLTDVGSSLMQWLDSCGIENSATERFVRSNAAAIRREAAREETRRDIETMRNIFQVLDVMEGYSSQVGKACELKRIVDEAIRKTDTVKLESSIVECFAMVAPNAVVRVSLAAIPKVGRYAEIFFDVTDLLRAEKVSVWSRFPFQGHVPTQIPIPGAHN